MGKVGPRRQSTGSVERRKLSRRKWLCHWYTIVQSRRRRVCGPPLLLRWWGRCISTGAYFLGRMKGGEQNGVASRWYCRGATIFWKERTYHISWTKTIGAQPCIGILTTMRGTWNQWCGRATNQSEMTEGRKHGDQRSAGRVSEKRRRSWR